MEKEQKLLCKCLEIFGTGRSGAMEENYEKGEEVR